MSTKSNQVNQQSKEENFARDAAVSTQQVELDLSFVISCKKLSQLYKVVPLQGLTSWAEFILCHIMQKTIPTLQGGAATRSNKLSSIYPLPNHAENYTNVRPPSFLGIREPTPFLFSGENHIIYCKVASRSPSQLVTCPGY